jgi:hypothetical protein
MRKVRVLARGLTQAEVEAAKKLAVEGGCTPDEIDVVAELGEPDPECDDELVLVIMTPTLCGDTKLETELKKSPNGGRRAICVWPAQAAGKQEPPAAVSNYAYSIIPWSADKFRAVAADDDVMCRETPDGVAMPQVKMEHNCCVDEGAKPK